MQNPRLAARYAKALIDIAKEQNALDTVLADMELIQATMKASKDLNLTIQSPIIKGDKKIEIFEAVFGNKIQNVTKLFVDLLVRKGREANLAEISTAYIEQYNQFNQIHVVKLTTATSMDDSLQSIIEQKVASQLSGGKVVVETAVQPDLIGGFVLQVGDKFFDASVKRDLNDVRHQFTQNIYVADI